MNASYRNLQPLLVAFVLLGALSPVVRAATGLDGLIAAYSADGNANDTAGVLNGTVLGGVNYAPGEFGQAFSFDGVDGHISLGNPAALKITGSLSVAAWINPREAPTTDLKAIVTKWGQVYTTCGPGSAADSYGLFLQKQGTGIELFGAIHLADLSEPNITGGSIPTNAFSHVAMTYDATAGAFAIYVNGAPVKSINFAPTPVCTSEKNVLIGGEDSFRPRRFPGLIDEVQIYGRALSAAEVTQLATGQAGGTMPSIIVLTNLDPASAPAGSLIVLSGSGFSTAAASNRVDFDGTPATVISATRFELGVIVPPSLPPGRIHAAVRAGTNQTAALAFDVIASAAVPNPVLRASRGPAGVVLAWPTNSAATLQATESLTPPVVWAPVTNLPAIQADQFTLSVAAEIRTRFFALGATSNSPAEPSLASSGTALVTAASGGTVTTADSSVILQVPAGALAADAQITVTAVPAAEAAQNGPGGDVVLAPEGLRFAKPARLTIRTPANPPADAHLNVQLLSISNTPHDAGGEGSYFTAVTNYTLTADGVLAMPLDHFSVLNWSWWAKNLYAVLDIPGRFLRKDDLLYVLTDAEGGQGGTWFPGHAGMYLGARDALADGNDGDTIIEATSTNSVFQGSVRFASFNSQEGFKLFGGAHIYLGARQPATFETTANERTDVADWAIGQLGKGYALSGGPFLNFGDIFYDGFSCVGLIELAYQNGAHKRIVPSTIARIALSPLRQFLLTRPVSSVVIDAGETVDTTVRGVVNIGTLTSDYRTEDSRYTRLLDLDACNQEGRDALAAGRAKFSEIFGLFTFTPIAADGGKDFKFAFVVDATQSGVGKERAFLTVTVNKATTRFVRQDPPLIETFSVNGNLEKTNIQATATEVFTSGYNGGPRLRMTWDAPPQTVTANSTVTLQLHADAGANPAQVSVFGGAPYLAGQINDSVDLTQNPAFAGYQFVKPNFSQNIYNLVQRDLTKDVTFGDVPYVTLEFNVFRTSGAFTAGTVGARLTWNYVPAP